MHYNTAAALEALQPPRLVHEGRTYEGRHLSVLEWAAYMQEVQALAKGKLNLLEVQVLYLKLMRAWFPPARRGWRPWPRESEAVRIFRRLPLAVQHDVVATFLRSQARTLGSTAPELGQSTDSGPWNQTS